MSEVPEGCRFAPRCPFASERCHHERPPIIQIDADHWSRCFKAPLESLVS
jgi:peptide/nickel transport system ATP-binding protein